MNYDDMSREQLIEIAKKAKDHEIKVNPEYLAAIATSENKQAGIIDTLRKENAELREQLEAIGAGGVSGKLMPGTVSAEPVGYVSKQAIERFQDGRHADIYPSIEELAHEFFDATPMALYAAPVAAQAQQPVSGADQFRDAEQMIQSSGNFGELPTVTPGDHASIKFTGGRFVLDGWRLDSRGRTWDQVDFLYAAALYMVQRIEAMRGSEFGANKTRAALAQQEGES